MPETTTQEGHERCTVITWGDVTLFHVCESNIGDGPRQMRADRLAAWKARWERYLAAQPLPAQGEDARDFVAQRMPVE